MTATALLEPSFADLLAAIAQAPELSEQRRRHWACSLQQIAKWLDRPAAVIPARWNAIQLSVGQLHHARVGVTAKTLANHKSNVRAALRWFGKEHGVPQRGVRLSAEWARFCDGLEKRIRDRLYSLDALLLGPRRSARRRSTTRSLMSTGATALRRPHAHRTIPPGALWRGRGMPVRLQSMAGRCERLTEPPLKVWPSPPGTTSPTGLRRDIDDYFAGLAKPHRSLKRQAHSAVQPGNNPNPPGRTCRDGPHGG